MNFQALKKTNEQKKRKAWKITSMILIGFILMAIATFVIFTINHTHYKVLSIVFHAFKLNIVLHICIISVLEHMMWSITLFVIITINAIIRIICDE